MLKNSLQYTFRLEEVGEVVEKIKVYQANGLNDKEIGVKLNIPTSRVYSIRSLFGLAGINGRPIDEVHRKVVNFKNKLTINAFSLLSVVNDLKLDPSKKYKWIATNLRPMQFTIKIEEQ